MPNVHVLALSGEIDLSRKQWIESELGQIERFGPQSTTIVDLNGVRYLDTTFFNALTRVHTRLRSAQPDSRICIVLRSDSLATRLFRITGLDQAFRLFDDVASARMYAYAAGGGRAS